MKKFIVSLFISIFFILFILTACQNPLYVNTEKDKKDKKDTSPQIFYPEISITESSNDIISSYNYDDVTTGSLRTADFIVSNIGELDLTIDTMEFITVYTDDFIVSIPTDDKIIPGDQIKITITLKPKNRGTKSGTLRIINNDADEGTFEINISGNSILYIPWMKLDITDDSIYQLVAHNEKIYTRSNASLYRSDDTGDSWVKILKNNDIIGGHIVGNIYEVDGDLDKLWIAVNNGILVSSDDGDTFGWSWYWHWDPNTSVDFSDGTGWCGVTSFGSRSGPNRKVGTGSWELKLGNIIVDHRSIYWVVADVVDPANYAYVYTVDWGGHAYRTSNGGSSWIEFDDENLVIYAAENDGNSIVYSNNAYSDDNAQTWSSLGITVSAIIKEYTNDIVFASKSSISYGVFFDDGGTWTEYGLNNKWIKYMSVFETAKDDYLLCVDNNGKLYRTNLTENYSRL